MLIRNVFDADFQQIADKSKEWGDVVIEREFIYHMLTTHFRSTCFIVEERGEMIGFLLGFRSQTDPGQAFIHLIQMAPERRGYGIGRKLFKHFEAAVKDMGCTQVCTMVRPENKNIGYYPKLGFEAVKGDNTIEVNGYPAVRDYNGPGKHMVLWCKCI